MHESREIDDQSKIQKDLLWGVYVELRNHARHSEMLRATVNNYVLLIASVLITIITFDKEINREDFPLTLIAVLVGFVGTVFSFSYTERYNRNRGRALQIIKHLDDIFFEGKSLRTLNSLNGQADEIHSKDFSYRVARRVTSTHWFWIMFPIMISFIGGILAVFSFFDL